MLVSHPRLRIVIGAGALAGALALTGCTAGAATNGSGSPSASASPSASTPASPAVSAISPAKGGLVGGGKVTITGTALGAVTAVAFGGVAGTDVTAVNDTTVTVVVPPVADFQPASVPVTVTAGSSTVDGAGDFSYASESPVDAQMEYLFQHWDNYNEAEWGNLNPVGGDCANFTNQGLIERGWKQNDDWFSRDAGTDRSGTWGYTPSMNTWMEQNAKKLGLKKLSLDQRDKLKIGDIGMFDWDDNGNPDHVMTVSRVTHEGGKTKVAFVSHNNDGDFRDLDVALNDEHPGATAWFWSVSD